MKEIWRPVKGYEELYEVSNLGKVKSFDRITIDKIGRRREYAGRIIKPFYSGSGRYLEVWLHKSGESHEFYLHRLVAEAFVKNEHCYPEVNHLDENPSNNCAENLCWVTQKENVNWGTGIQRRVRNTDFKKMVAHTDYKKKVEHTDLNKMADKLKKKVNQFTMSGNLVRQYAGAIDVKSNGFDRHSVSECCRGIRKAYKNYLWAYAEKV